MLLTLTATSLRSMLAKGRGGRGRLDLTDLPQHTRNELGLHGLNLSTDLLSGTSRQTMETIRERADRVGCACLLLIEPEPQPFGDASETAAAGAIDRLRRVIAAAQVLGCNAVAVTPAGPDDPGVFARTAERLKKAVERAEKLELNVLISPRGGLTATPARVAELIKKIGGFRVGTYPDFQAASSFDDPVGYLRRLVPYASVVAGTTVRFAEGLAEDAPPRHEAYDLKPLVDAILSVGYDGTLAVDYRGEGDVTLGVIRSRRALEALLDQEGGKE